MGTYHFDYVEWKCFDKGHSDKLMSSDLDGDGVLETDVLIQRTPWVGGPPTERDYRVLESIANMMRVPGKKMIVEFPMEEYENRTFPVLREWQL